MLAHCSRRWKKRWRSSEWPSRVFAIPVTPSNCYAAIRGDLALPAESLLPITPATSDGRGLLVAEQHTLHLFTRDA